MKDLIILGAGPAGISAAIYALRSNLKIKVIGKKESELERAHIIENYFGADDSPNGPQLMERGRTQLYSLGGEITEEEIVGILWDNCPSSVASDGAPQASRFSNGCFTVITDKGEHTSRVIIFATGNARKKLKIQGMEKFEGNGISYCAVCDAFFYKGKPVAVLGAGEYALHEAQTLLNTSEKVYILSNGQQLTAEFPNSFKVITEPIAQLYGDKSLEGAILQNGEKVNFNGLFMGLGTASSTELAAKLGIICENGKITVDKGMSTNLPGAFAAGDCTSKIMQVAVAVGDGCKAALGVIEYLKS